MKTMYLKWILVVFVSGLLLLHIVLFNFQLILANIQIIYKYLIRGTFIYFNNQIYIGKYLLINKMDAGNQNQFPNKSRLPTFRKGHLPRGGFCLTIP